MDENWWAEFVERSRQRRTEAKRVKLEHEASEKAQIQKEKARIQKDKELMKKASIQDVQMSKLEGADHRQKMNRILSAEQE